MKRLLVAFALIFCVTQAQAYSNRFGLSANLLDYARLGTMNMDFSYAVSKHWSLMAGARYNPFTFRKGDPDRQFQYRQISCAAGARLWPWHVWSGWWFAGKVRYQEYNAGGLGTPETEEGDRVGAGLYAGYTLMLTPHLNMEFGLGFWGGLDWYRRYSCPVCGILEDGGRRPFVRPDDFMISLVYVF